MGGRGGFNILLVVLAAVPLVVTIVDFVLAQGNQALQAEVSRRQHRIAEGAQLARIDQVLIRQIAVAALKNRDAKLRDLLSRNGITIRVTPASPSGDGKAD
jgi:heme exporter protein D